MRSILTALQEGRLFELPESGKDRALEFLARIIDANPDIEVGTDTIEEIQKRELECNTGIGMGVGVPHIRSRREAGDLFCAVGWSPAGIEYGAIDNEQVHLVVMYYVPGAQKNVYLKEVSTLVKAIKKSGGISPIAHAVDLNAVRNQLLDWVGSAMGDAGPEAIARMIKLDVRHTQSAVASTPAFVQPPVISVRSGTKALSFQVLVSSPTTTIVLSADSEFVSAAEHDGGLGTRLAAESSFILAGRTVLVLGGQPYAGGRILYQCVALP